MHIERVGEGYCNLGSVRECFPTFLPICHFSNGAKITHSVRAINAFFFIPRFILHASIALLLLFTFVIDYSNKRHR